ncbi:NAD-dependent epimerase/dehydratase family protein [Patescibacteria group bacterium]|nr:NAD-dependent epimerase/dehydratase family protein [Patescibacteria group bacterium]MBU1967419.1 NAD-dependent epimerase/dehydratase family protein [Patescibacteria group bacterium]MBU2543330.1 NAD-dependent epimerase/dehydratase family protein [Patescibacteria group bacterium]
MKKFLVTGAFGQIGSELVPALQQKYGVENIIAMGNRNIPQDFAGVVEKLELPNFEGLKTLIKKYDVGEIYHMVSLLSAKGEEVPDLAWEVNVQSLKDVLDLAREYKLKVFWPSSIAAFGPTTPRENTPQQTILEPTTMYGVTKVAGELLCQYYHFKYGIDIRSVRYPGLISIEVEPSGGTTDYAAAIYFQAVKNGQYTFYVRPDTTLPMMYMDDAVKGTIQLMETKANKLTIHTSYNFAAMSFQAHEVAEEIQKHMKLKVDYQPDHRQAIADSWPQSIDDSVARKDWGWQHEYDLAKMTERMLSGIKERFK